MLIFYYRLFILNLCFFQAIPTIADEPTTTLALLVGLCLLLVQALILPEQYRIKFGLAVFMFALILLEPELLTLLPLISFELCRELSIARTPELEEQIRALQVVVIFFLAVLLLHALTFYPLPQLLALLPFSFVAGALGYSSERELYLNRRLHQVRDEQQEKILTLSSKLKSQRMEDEKNRHMVRLDERNRISRELHDVTGHTLSSALLQVGALEVLNQKDSLKEPLNRLHQTLDTGMTDIRNTLHDMRADSCDLEFELQKVLDNASQFETHLRCHLGENLPLQFKLDLIAIAREAVTNAMKHSNGRRLEIKAIQQPSLFSLTIWDNGESDINSQSHVLSTKDNSDRQSSDPGMGLDNMRALAERNNGRLNLRRKPGHGFTVHAVFMREERKETP